MDDTTQTHSEPNAREAPSTSSQLPKFDAILSIPVVVQVVLGSTTMPVASLMKLGRGAVISLDQRVGDPVNIIVNGRVVARAEVAVIDEDNSRFGVSLLEVMSPSSRDRAA
jgi:flagellar motor switch protein FliN